MAVRFLPLPGSENAPGGDGVDRADLAEVIQLRGQLPQRAWADQESVASETEGSTEPDERAAVVSQLGARITRASAPDESSAFDVSSAPDESGTRDEAVDHHRAAYDDGVRLLARRARSTGELREELMRLDHAAGDVDVVIDEFCDSLYLDDLALARAVCEKLRDVKKASRSQIRIKLRDRRLPDGVIEEAIGELDDDEEFALLRAAAENRASKLSGLDRPVAERRLLGFLARRGWSGEPAMRVAREALDGTSSSRGSKGGPCFR